MRKTFTLISIVALVVSACGDDTAEETTTTEASETTTTQGQETSTTGAETTTSAPVAGGGGDECLVGSWALDTESFFEAVMGAAGQSEDIGEFTPGGGTAITTFAPDGTMTDVRQDWGFSLVTSDGTVNMSMNGEQSGTWDAQGSMLSISLTQSEPFDIDVTVESGGQTISLPDSPVPIPTESVNADGEYNCDDNTLTVTANDITWEFSRVD